jgi:hypothetical protein
MLLSCNYQQKLLIKLNSPKINQTKYLCTQFILSNKFSNNILNRNSLNKNNLNRQSFFKIESPLIFSNQLKSKFHNNSILFEMVNEKNVKEAAFKTGKKQSKFRQFYAQYGPTFLVVHLTTVVMWIYLFYVISKQ